MQWVRAQAPGCVQWDDVQAVSSPSGANLTLTECYMSEDSGHLLGQFLVCIQPCVTEDVRGVIAINKQGWDSNHGAGNELVIPKQRCVSIAFLCC